MSTFAISLAVLDAMYLLATAARSASRRSTSRGSTSTISTIGSPSRTRLPSRTNQRLMRPPTSTVISCSRSSGSRAVIRPIPTDVCTHGVNPSIAPTTSRPSTTMPASTRVADGARTEASVSKVSRSSGRATRRRSGTATSRGSSPAAAGEGASGSRRAPSRAAGRAINALRSRAGAQPRRRPSTARFPRAAALRGRARTAVRWPRRRGSGRSSRGRGGSRSR